MARLLSRTSITIDEAVSILLGRSTGPIDFEPMDVAEDAEADVPVFCLRDTLEDELDVLAGECDMAIHERLPEHVIAEKRAALQHQEEVIGQANLYLCAIQNELNKGEQSVLKLDRALSNPVYQFITLHSFNEWLNCSAGDQPGGVAATEAILASKKGPKKKKPRTRLIQQENAILEEIRKQGLDPLAFPPHPSGRRGAKAAICEALKNSPLFEGSRVFDKAWERLRSQRHIADQA
jgi:hypothetical protein